MTNENPCNEIGLGYKPALHWPDLSCIEYHELKNQYSEEEFKKQYLCTWIVVKCAIEDCNNCAEIDKEYCRQHRQYQNYSNRNYW